MNCQLCQKEFEAYREGKLTPDIRNQIESHLKTCYECNEIYRLQILADRVITEEKELHVNPFLATRVMARIENEEAAGARPAPQIFRPVLIAISMATAVFLGVTIGNISADRTGSKAIPVELALIDDVRLESLEMLSNE